MFRDFIYRHKQEYFRLAQYTPPSLTSAQQIALYECEKIHTAYLNNLKSQFGNRLRLFLNFVFRVKQRSSDIRTRMTNERYSESSIRDTVNRNVYQPCNKIKDQFSKKMVPIDDNNI
jgi:hypothetical protein